MDQESALRLHTIKELTIAYVSGDNEDIQINMDDIKELKAHWKTDARSKPKLKLLSSDTPGFEPEVRYDDLFGEQRDAKKGA